MKHLGDISKINGAEIEPIDCIVGGSPCQDLSVAGLRKGLQHESKGDAETTRSGLFIEQIRVTKELRKHDRELGRADQYVRPRYFVWENVPGALSSNKGEDFRCVLEETARIVQEDAVIPKPPRGGVVILRVHHGKRVFHRMASHRCTVLGCTSTKTKSMFVGRLQWVHRNRHSL